MPCRKASTQRNQNDWSTHRTSANRKEKLLVDDCGRALVYDVW